jgi:hypothetical protein
MAGQEVYDTMHLKCYVDARHSYDFKNDWSGRLRRKYS